jgi:2'-5' RNA ligase
MSSPGSVAGDERIRLFCALRLPEDVLDRLEAWQAAHLSGRIVTRANLHITLAFLGHRPRRELDAISEAVRRAAAKAQPITLSARRYRETRSVGMVELADEDGASVQLADRLHGKLERLRVYEREKRRWLPHVTVLRFREPPRLQPPPPDLGAFSPSEAAVYHSVLRPGGAQYEVLESVALGGFRE